ncbi:UDP-2,4-diacetamido-2,4,6-trideoxy-beta-L-altropyranose hydrolase [Escherichia coli]|uniref:UDP-2,4-diacetamido-2,4, 6-trideoxy-beta-L-altropyranose hydrolase n=1 Tax=Escherichia coli TaxID=562 RepID=UPI001D2F82F5|nr:UDP-2,4-diacetamido-2,4,6-trideoxy-beta-L-altropyranose hydrolase [Escherichia coli]EES4951244.1 UDP-2,4-diacetamido-2,4,6-trideoxy-beta-L-altropyranose hydrolase [Escherichia coli]
MKVFLRVDSSLSIGSGHIIRCINIATMLRKMGAECIFITKNHKGNIISKIRQADFLFEVMSVLEEPEYYISNEKEWLNGRQSDDAVQFSSLLSQYSQKPDIIIVDHYSLDSEWEIIVKQNFPQARLVVIDDLCNRKHHCDLLIDQTYLRHKHEYAELILPETKILTGTKFALVNTDFYKFRNESIIRKKNLKRPLKLMITMGGVDANNITGKVLQYLEEINYKNIQKITVIIGSKCPHRTEICELTRNSKYNIQVVIDISNMAELMLEHDFAIGALGGTTWERCVMGLPAVNIAIARNQHTVAQNLSKSGAIVLYSDKFKKSEFSNALDNLMANYYQQSNLVRIICDGHGLYRIVQEIIPNYAKDGINVALRPATIDDISFVYRLQCEPHTRRFARNPNIPTFENHSVWMRCKLLEEKSLFYIIEHEGACGVLRLDAIEHKTAQYEISVFLTSRCIGKGIASAAIRRAMMLNNNSIIMATVLLENYASHQLFKNLGYKQISQDKYISRKNDE